MLADLSVRILNSAINPRSRDYGPAMFVIPKVSTRRMGGPSREGTVWTRPTSGRNRLYDILVAGEIAIHSSAVGGTSTALPDVRRRGVEHVNSLCCENRRFGSS